MAIYIEIVNIFIYSLSCINDLEEDMVKLSALSLNSLKRLTTFGGKLLHIKIICSFILVFGFKLPSVFHIFVCIKEFDNVGAS